MAFYLTGVSRTIGPGQMTNWLIPTSAESYSASKGFSQKQFCHVILSCPKDDEAPSDADPFFEIFEKTKTANFRTNSNRYIWFEASDPQQRSLRFSDWGLNVSWMVGVTIFVFEWMRTSTRVFEEAFEAEEASSYWASCHSRETTAEQTHFRPAEDQDSLMMNDFLASSKKWCVAGHIPKVCPKKYVPHESFSRICYRQGRLLIFGALWFSCFETSSTQRSIMTKS